MNPETAVAVLEAVTKEKQVTNDAIAVAMQFLLRIAHGRLQEVGATGGSLPHKQLEQSAVIFMATIVAIAKIFHCKAPGALTQYQNEYLAVLEKAFLNAGFKFPDDKEIESNFQFIQNFGREAFGYTIDTQQPAEPAWAKKENGEVGH